MPDKYSGREGGGGGGETYCGEGLRLELTEPLRQPRSQDFSIAVDMGLGLIVLLITVTNK